MVLNALSPQSPAEHLISKSLEDSSEADLSGSDIKERELRAEWLAATLPAIGSGGVVRIRGAVISGALDLRFCLIEAALDLRDCVLKSPIVLEDATIRSLSLTGTALVAFKGARLRVKGPLFLQGVVSEAAIELRDSEIEGCVDLRAANIGTKLARNNIAFDGTGLHVGRDLRFTGGFVAHGGIRLVRARVSDNVDFYDREDGDLIGSKVEWIRMVRCQIGGELDLRRVCLCATQGEAFGGQGMRVTGTFYWRLMGAPLAQVNLQRAKVGQLNDGVKSWPDHVSLAGFEYDALDTFSSDDNTKKWPTMTSDERLQVLARSTPFSPQPYEQAIRVLRRQGSEREARRLAISKQREIRRKGTLGWSARVVSKVLDALIGYGYQVWRLAIIAVLFVGVGTAVFSERNLRRPAQATTATVVEQPPLYPIVYSLDAFIPGVNFRQEESRAPANSAVLAYYCCHVLMGWILTALLIAAWTGLLKKD